MGHGAGGRADPDDVSPLSNTPTHHGAHFKNGMIRRSPYSSASINSRQPEIIIDSRVGQGALDAMLDYGRTANHPAALDLGDCLSYAAAKSNGLKLPYKSHDFSKRDMA